MLLAGALVVAAPSQAADSSETAAAYFSHAAELVRARDFERAAVEFERAYALSPHFSTLYNLGQAYVMLDKPVQAVNALKRFLTQGGSRIPKAQRTTVENQLRIQIQRVGVLAVRTDPTDATLYVDDQVVLQDRGEEIAVTAGIHRVHAEHPDYLPRSVDVELTLGKRVDLVLGLAVRPPEPMKSATGRIAFACNVPRVVVQIDGEPASPSGQHPTPTGSIGSLEVATGLHEVSFERRGYVAQRQRLTVESGAVHSVHCGLQPRSDLTEQNAGTLRVRGEPGLTVLIDGLVRRDARLPLGPHHVVAGRGPGSPSWETEAELAPGKTTTIFLPTSGHDTEPSPSNRAMLGWILGATGLALGGGSFGVYLASSVRFSRYEQEQAELYRLRGKGVDTASRQASNDERSNSIRTLDNLAAALAGAGTGLVASGALLLLLSSAPGGTTSKQASSAPPLGLRIEPRRSAELSWSATW